MSLEFFNRLSGTLAIELTEPTEEIAPNLANRRATATAAITGVTFALEVFEDERFRDLTVDEFDRVVLKVPVLNLRGLGDPVEHRASNGKWFTVRDLAAAIAETERSTRGQSRWYGGVDVHHIYFEGIHEGDAGVWEIHWGS
ncbi:MULTISPECIES: hypothetical protein [unclassified Nocardia]|uniref:hypothetical protein n=1 Tax=unclassified Nocardia TaxID=2637762 RepID=UPI001CE401C7|nr:MULTISPECIES: hypothetical protein [unclassified Nocardia]